MAVLSVSEWVWVSLGDEISSMCAVILHLSLWSIIGCRWNVPELLDTFEVSQISILIVFSVSHFCPINLTKGLQCQDLRHDRNEFSLNWLDETHYSVWRQTALKGLQGLASPEGTWHAHLTSQVPVTFVDQKCVKKWSVRKLTVFLSNARSK